VQNLELKNQLYFLTSDLNRLKSRRRDILERNITSMPPELEIELIKLNTLISEKEAEIRNIL
jgi:hypothetical protein